MAPGASEGASGYVVRGTHPHRRTLQAERTRRRWEMPAPWGRDPEKDRSAETAAVRACKDMATRSWRRVALCESDNNGLLNARCNSHALTPRNASFSLTHKFDFWQ